MKHSLATAYSKADKKEARWDGLFIVFEGIDGTGKSSQLKRLGEILDQGGYPFISTREPSDGPFGTRLRELFYSREQLSSQEELQLFIDDRKDHLARTILPALNNGIVVLCDRYFLSTVAYQGATGHFSVEQLLAENSFAPVPDIALLLSAPVPACLQRITVGRNEKPNDFEQQLFLEKAHAIFATLEFPWLKKIDCSRSIDDVTGEIEKHIQPLLMQRYQKESAL